MRMFFLVLVPTTTAQRVPLGDSCGPPIANLLAVIGLWTVERPRRIRSRNSVKTVGSSTIVAAPSNRTM